jgi:hypothetical protein
MVMVGTIHRPILALAFAGAALFALRSASAQPVVDQALSDAQVAVEKGCTILKVTFNIRIYLNPIATHPLERSNFSAIQSALGDDLVAEK